mgnify:CR=1 FL=1
MGSNPLIGKACWCMSAIHQRFRRRLVPPKLCRLTLQRVAVVADPLDHFEHFVGSHAVATREGPLPSAQAPTYQRPGDKPSTPPPARPEGKSRPLP